ncbi:MAG: M20/M25/M40 family metallo-hydrolase [Planctomycetota bacterium]|nr:M20/M25/M40 family metallo-hydrolase [Planctomycetota bacterium]
MRDAAKELTAAIQYDRLLDTAIKLVEVPSPTRSAADVLDRLDEILRAERFSVERPAAGWPEAPAVVSRYESGQPGKTLQFNGHLDTVHLPFVPPRVENGVLYGSGCSDMKGGIAACVEAMRALRETGLLTAGAVMLTAHDLHETPWGDGTQLNGLIDEGYLGDAVLLPEYLADPLPVIGRGLSVLNVKITRAGEPVHEVLGGSQQPSVIRAGAEVVRRFAELDEQLRPLSHPLAGRESMFVGQFSSGEIYNQAPIECMLAGTRRWLPGTAMQDAEDQFQQILAEVAQQHGVQIEGRFQVARDAYEIDPTQPFVAAFQSAHRLATGRLLSIGAKPFVDDGNEFVNRGGIPAITHGPDAKGAHTLYEEVAVAELVRVALVYALTAVEFCQSG